MWWRWNGWVARQRDVEVNTGNVNSVTQDTSRENTQLHYMHFCIVPNTEVIIPLRALHEGLLHSQGCQKFRAQVAANFTKSRGRQRKSSPIFPKLKMHPKCLNLGTLCAKLTKNHPNGRKNNRLSNFRKLRIITFEAFRWLYMTS